VTNTSLALYEHTKTTITAAPAEFLLRVSWWVSRITTPRMISTSPITGVPRACYWRDPLGVLEVCVAALPMMAILGIGCSSSPTFHGSQPVY